MSIVVVGPSGSGKTTIIKQLSKIFDIPINISCTTRKPRIGEVNGVDYNFISEEAFKLKMQNGAFEEYAIFNGNYYGTLKVTNETKLYDVEYRGLYYFKKAYENWIFIYVDVCKNILRDRLVKRGSLSEEIERRLATFDYFEEIKKKVALDLIVSNNKQLSDTVEIIVRFLNEKDIKQH